MADGNGRVRVVVTGMGAISPLGNDATSTWQAVREGRSGVDAIENFDASALPVRFAAEVKGFDPAEALGRKEARRSSRSCHFALVAAREAVQHSGFDVAAEAEDVGVLIASGIGGLEWIEKGVLALAEGGPRRVSPFTVPTMIADMPAGMVAIDHGAKGPNFAVVSACASGAHAIGEAAEWIRRGDATAVLAGGTEGCITPVAISAFAAMQALSTRNDDPQHASRPFAKDRDGFVIAEGAAILVLEELGHAQARGATIYAEVVGYGASADAYHMTQPDEEGDGARRCMQRALLRAGAQPEDVDYINAHGTSTQMNDAAETRAIKKVFGDGAYRVPISSTKSMTGHLLGAAGALEAVFSVLAIRDHYLPPTVNLDTPDPECDLDYVPNVGREASPSLVLSTSFGFGGHNACLAIAAPPA
ncbi:MAG TPA: beta-ketoacyl-ACP synthase II [Candidatus Dormibacteraeota bacterium]|jgi:3-oxoacyl-[acyl-carrier-protein] synthase II|nr:beta-ketoacyl-ACP synthase II [Candidatus Dormibacteraeota bacterium]